jgi:hypothetical protein
MRLSNYLVWQAAYAEYHSTPALWPDFDHDEFVAALDAYAARKRRFGKTDEQLAAEAQPVRAAQTAQLAQTEASAPGDEGATPEPAVKSIS